MPEEEQRNRPEEEGMVQMKQDGALGLLQRQPMNPRRRRAQEAHGGRNGLDLRAVGRIEFALRSGLLR